jgi:hypothetical protein
MTFKESSYYTTVTKAKDQVPGFREAFSCFEERFVLDQCSKSTFTNYSSNLAHLATHLDQVLHAVRLKKSMHLSHRSNEARISG